jgi:hypothetical protein
MRLRLTILSPNLRTPNPGFNPGFTSPLTNLEDAPRVKTGDWRPELWAQGKNAKNNFSVPGFGLEYDFKQKFFCIWRCFPQLQRKKLSRKLYICIFRTILSILLYCTLPPPLLSGWWMEWNYPPPVRILNGFESVWIPLYWRHIICKHNTQPSLRDPSMAILGTLTHRWARYRYRGTLINS